MATTQTDKTKPLFKNGTKVKALKIRGEKGYDGIVIDHDGYLYLVDHGKGNHPVWYPDYSLTKI